MRKPREQCHAPLHLWHTRSVIFCITGERAILQSWGLWQQHSHQVINSWIEVNILIWNMWHTDLPTHWPCLSLSFFIFDLSSTSFHFSNFFSVGHLKNKLVLFKPTISICLNYLYIPFFPGECSYVGMLNYTLWRDLVAGGSDDKHINTINYKINPTLILASPITSNDRINYGGPEFITKTLMHLSFFISWNANPWYSLILESSHPSVFQVFCQWTLCRLAPCGGPAWRLHCHTYQWFIQRAEHAICHHLR